MIHLYWGEGKGKTTAAMGLALRALGHHQNVIILQFLKDGSSGEIEPLRRLGATVYACPNAKFTWLMNEEDRAQTRASNTTALQRIADQNFDLCILGRSLCGLSEQSCGRSTAAAIRDTRWHSL